MNQKQHQQNTRRKTPTELNEAIIAGDFNITFSVIEKLDTKKLCEKWRISNNTLLNWTQVTEHEIKRNKFSSPP